MVDKTTGDKLKQYMINLLNSLKEEVDEQFGMWGKQPVGFLAQLCYAQKQAVDNQFNVLKEQEEERRRSFERCLFVLELLSIGAASWIGAALKLRVGPKLFWEYETTFFVLPARWLRKIPKPFEMKVFGDLGHDLADMLFKAAGETFSAPAYKEMDPNKVAHSPDADIFGSNLYHEVEAQRLQAVQAIAGMAQSINNSVTFGEAMVKRLQRENPRFIHLDPKGQELAGHKRINDLLNLYRQAWADKWLYYGSDPPQPHWPRVIEELERELWALWVIQQHFHLEKLGAYQVVDGASGPVLNTSGGFASLIKESPISRRLFELNAPVMKIILEGSPRSQEQVDLLNKWAIDLEPTWLASQMQGKRRQLKPVDQLW